MTGVKFPARVMIGLFPFATASRQVLRHTQLPTQWILGALTLEGGVKWLGCRAIPPLPKYIFLEWC